MQSEQKLRQKETPRGDLLGTTTDPDLEIAETGIPTTDTAAMTIGAPTVGDETRAGSGAGAGVAVAREDTEAVVETDAAEGVDPSECTSRKAYVK